MKQIGLALHNYHDVFSVFPYGYNGYGTTGALDPGGCNRVYGRWIHFILPHMDQMPAYRQFSTYFGWDCRASNVAAIETNLTTVYGLSYPAFYYPSETSPQVIEYSWPLDTEIISPNRAAISSDVGCTRPNTSDDCAAFSYPMAGLSGSTGIPLCQFIGYQFRENESAMDSQGMFAQNKGRKSVPTFLDGTSNTIAVSELTFQRVGIGAVTNSPFGGWDHASTAGMINWPGRIHNWGNASMFASYHTGGAQFLMADGAVRLFSQNFDMRSSHTRSFHRHSHGSGQ